MALATRTLTAIDPSLFSTHRELRAGAIPEDGVPGASLGGGKRFHKAVAEFDAVVEILDAYALVFAVRAVVFHIEKHAGNAISGDAGDAEIFSIGGAGGHRRDDGDAGQHCGRWGGHRQRKSFTH